MIINNNIVIFIYDYSLTLIQSPQFKNLSDSGIFIALRSIVLYSYRRVLSHFSYIEIIYTQPVYFLYFNSFII